jgi:hypothetical protein
VLLQSQFYTNSGLGVASNVRLSRRKEDILHASQRRIFSTRFKYLVLQGLMPSIILVQVVSGVGSSLVLSKFEEVVMAEWQALHACRSIYCIPSSSASR